MHKTVKDRYFTFYLVLAQARSDMPEAEWEALQDRIYPLWSEAKELLAGRQHALSRRTFLDEYQVEISRWEWCDQQGHVEVRGENKLAWPIQFYFNQDPDPADLQALRELTVSSFKEVCEAAGVDVEYLHTESSITYEVSERAILD